MTTTTSSTRRAELEGLMSLMWATAPLAVGTAIGPQQSAEPLPGRTRPLPRRTTGAGATGLAVGPMLAPTLEALRDRDVTVLYANDLRPFDSGGLRAALRTPDVVLVEPTLAVTSSRHVAEALVDTFLARG